MTVKLNRVCLLLCFASALLLQMGCAKSRQSVFLDEDAVVLAFGDSLTFGYGAEAKNSYPVLLEGMIGCEVINAGVSGERSASGLKRLPVLLEAYNPNLVILCHGGNDILKRSGTEKIIKDIESMLGMIKNAESEVILLGVPRPGLFLSSADFYDEIAKRHHIPYNGKIIPKVLSKDKFKSDTIHPNAEGYRLIAEAVAEFIK